MQPIWRHRFGIGLLLLTAATCSAQEARNPDYDYSPGYGPIKWPERRQHLLAGRYIGKIQVQVDRGACLRRAQICAWMPAKEAGTVATTR
ncbi:hypothetical protein FHY31_000491 [Xanthomonas euvesicatoria]|uniref:Uncharacterized protein n=1 Tax=Xanthomonas euvesicatoria TaxID=456327 RepID=A0AAW3U0Q6_XANEU|nr:hypothetical protein [Xanthomonas euvesicatoria]MBB4868786.1 hypothetical protein [Xanthomonas euvesicatoria]